MKNSTIVFFVIFFFSLSFKGHSQDFKTVKSWPDGLYSYSIPSEWSSDTSNSYVGSHGEKVLEDIVLDAALNKDYCDNLKLFGNNKGVSAETKKMIQIGTVQACSWAYTFDAGAGDVFKRHSLYFMSKGMLQKLTVTFPVKAADDVVMNRIIDSVVIR